MRILRETFHDVAVIKPAGMATEMRSDSLGESLLSRLSLRYPGHKVKLPHRLDKSTRGIVLAALSDEAVRHYNREIRHGLWDKYYLGRVRTPPYPVGTSLLGPHKAYLRQKNGRSVVVRSGGDPSKLEILLMTPSPRRPGESHVLLRLLTGRYHQIRVMLEALGIPLVGDPVYPGSLDANPGPFYLEHILLRCRDFTSGEGVTLHLRDDPEREPVSDEMGRYIAAVLRTYE